MNRAWATFILVIYLIGTAPVIVWEDESTVLAIMWAFLTAIVALSVLMVGVSKNDKEVRDAAHSTDATA